MKKLLASSMGSNEKVNSNKLFCTLKISKGLIEYVQVIKILLKKKHSFVDIHKHLERIMKGRNILNIK